MLVPEMIRPAVLAAKELLPQNIIAAEIGVQSGINAASIMQHLPIKELWLVDVWEEYSMSVPKRNLERIEVSLNFADQFSIVTNKFAGDERVHIIKGLSEHAVREFEDGFFNFIYIDACHSYEMAKFDIDAWLPKLASGGIFSGHDYHPEWPGVIKAVDELSECIEAKILFSDRDWWFVK